MLKKNTEYFELVNKLTTLIESTKFQVSSHANSSLTILFWHIGQQISTFVLENRRADYGKQIVVTVSRDLVERFGKNYEEKNLRRMIQFAKEYPNIENVVTLSRNLSWSHFLVLIPVKNREVRRYYEKLSSQNLIGVRELGRQIRQKTFERIKNADIQISESNVIKRGIFKDLYLLDFLDLKNGYRENDLEAAILKDLELFILELGDGFTFVERQKRMIIDGDNYNLDLQFYHRKLKRLVAVELKIDKFRAKYKGQMELYLKWLNKYEKQEGEQASIGLNYPLPKYS